MEIENNDIDFEKRLTAALYRAHELANPMPSDEEIERIVQPSPQAQRKMRKLLKNPRKYLQNRRRPAYIRVLRGTAAACIAFILLFGGTVAASPSVRAAVISFVMTWLPDRAEYETTPGTDIAGWTVGYVPEGFEPELADSLKTEFSATYIYKKNDVVLFIAIQSGRTIIDNEHSDYYRTTINGHTADVYKSNTASRPDNIIVIYDESENVFITLTSALSVDELMKVGESINKIR